ncbi:bile acid:sodium symporter family protein [Haloferax sp. YSMS24]|uniref:bile acid:sodium symporter family protein n=1 Tax=unclassified Haloferax TaxID=2625095 RepID=UPI00398D2AE8
MTDAGVSSNLDLLVRLLSSIQGIAAVVALAALMAAFGIQLTRGDILRTIREYNLVGRWLLTNLVFVPLLALLFGAVFDLSQPFLLTFVLVAVAPGAPFIPQLIRLAGEDSHEAVRLTTALTVISVVTVPVFVAAMLFVLQVETSVSPWRFFLPLTFVLLVPVVAGILVRALRPELATRLARPVVLLANLSLVLALGITLLLGLDRIIDVFVALFATGALLLMSLFVFASIGIGWVLGGPTQQSRRILALGTAGRNVNIALFIAVAVFPDTGVDGGIVAFTVLMFVNSILVALYWKRAHGVSGVGPDGNESGRET